MSYYSIFDHPRFRKAPDFDYLQNSVYYITITTYHQACLFGEVVQGKMSLNYFGILIKDEWYKSSNIFPRVKLDSFVIMPNHFHGIILVYEEPDQPERMEEVEKKRLYLVEDAVALKPPAPSSPSKTRSIETFVTRFKSHTTRQVNQVRQTHNQPLWQRNYYEHRIYNDESLEKTREYVLNNPSLWEEDQFNPANLAKVNEAHGLFI